MWFRRKFYASNIISLVNSGKKGAALEAEQMFQTMCREEEVAPKNRIALNTMMNTIAKSNERGSVERAEAVLNQMEELYEAARSPVIGTVDHQGWFVVWFDGKCHLWQSAG